jgi:putative ABC transport system ATP-binding protein
MALVELNQVGRRFPGPPEVVALASATLNVEQGEYLSIIGPSGSGKSTLLNLIGMLDTPTSGCYRFDGEDVAGFSEAQRTRFRGEQVGFVFQDFYLIGARSATENVCLPLVYAGATAKERVAAAREVLELVGLGHRVDALPTTMSGGERQRVAIARALVHKPRLLLCDEPTGNLDSATTAKILDLIDELRATGVTVITITHDPVTAARADRRVAIRDGFTSEATNG